jgi:hypothetical protein
LCGTGGVGTAVALDEPPGDGRGDQGPAAAHGANGADELRPPDILEQEAAGSGGDREETARPS